jgi:N-hydroxyarylamine O-acetyltransferase
VSSSSVIDRSVDRLGLGDIAHDADGLRTVYRRWCRTVPFDSLQKRIFQAAGATGPVPGATAEAFLADWLADGTGGSCWSTSLGLHAILGALGFDARLCAGVMLTDPTRRPNHGSIVVDVDGREWLVDTSMLFDAPLVLPPPGATHLVADPVHPVSAVGHEDHWVVTWRPAHADVEVPCEIERRACASDVWWDAHEATRAHSLFNQSLYARRNDDAGIVAYGRGKLVERDRSGRLVRRTVEPADVGRTLVERFGFSERIVALLPADDDGEAFL